MVSSCSRMRANAALTAGSSRAGGVFIAEPLEGVDQDGELHAEVVLGDARARRREIEPGRVPREERLGFALAGGFAQGDLVDEARAVKLERLGGRGRALGERGPRVDPLPPF